jgi:hypothetical protein
VPGRIHFEMAELPPDREEIASALAPLAEAGWNVTVEPPRRVTTELGWRVSLDKPGRHTSFRIRVGASAAEWTASVLSVLRPS